MTWGARLRRGTDWLEARLRRRGAGWALLLAVAVLYSWAYWRDELNPGAATVYQRIGWWSWFDQQKYGESAAALAAGRIDRETYYYPLGYPALGAVFARVWPAHPFFVPGLLLTIATAAAGWQFARRWLGATATLGLAIGFVVSHAALLRLTMVIPWNTLPTQAALATGLWLTVARRDGRGVLGLALLAAATWWTRPSDAVCFAPLLLVATLRLPTWRARLGWGALGAGVIALAVLAMGALNLRVFGSWRTPYEEMSVAAIGFFSYPVAEKLFWLFVDARPFFGEPDTALLWRYPWLWAVLPGAVWWLRRDGWAAAAGLAAIALNWALYLAYNDFLPSGLFRFSQVHYLTWAFVPLATIAVAALATGRGDRAARAAWGVTALLLVAALGLQLEERPLPIAASPGRAAGLPKDRVVWVRFPGEPLERVTALRLDGRAIHEVSDYQIPYVPAELRLLLMNDRLQGDTLQAEPAEALRAVPAAGDFTWGWRWDGRRALGGR